MEVQKGEVSSPLAKLEAAGYVQLAKSLRGNTHLTVCSLTKKGREALEGYAQKLRGVSRAAGGSKGGKVLTL